MDKNRMNDRHNVPRPTAADNVRATGTVEVGEGRYLDGFKGRISDLFKTQGGLAGHVRPMQDTFTSLSNSDLPDDKKKAVAVKAYEQLVKAAQHAAFDFDPIEFKVASISWHMTIGKKGTKIIQSKS
jgi:hypothetical protein